MVDPNKISGGPDQVFKNRPSPQQLGKKHSSAVFDMFKRGLGIDDLTADALGAFAKPFVQGLTTHFTKLAQDKGIISAKDTQAILGKLRELHSLDQFIAAPPAEVTHANGQLDRRTYAIKETGERGQYKAEGSITKKDHAMGVVFDRLGLSMNGFGQDVADILDFAGNAKKNLGDRDSWITIVGQMAMAAFGAPGDVKAKVGAALNAGLQGVTQVVTTPAPDKLESRTPTARTLGSTKGSGVGLEHTAPKTSNTGSMSGALAVRAALLSGLKDQDDAVERTAGKVLGQVMKHLGVEPDKATKKQLHLTLKRLMTDTSSPNGKANPVHLMGRAVEALAAKDPNSALLGDLNQWIQKAVIQNPDFKPDAGVQEAFGAMAATALTELVAKELGKAPPADGKLSDEVFGALKDLLTKAPEAPGETRPTQGVNEGATPKTQNLPPVDISVWDCDRADLPQQLKDAALQFLTQQGVSAEHPRSLALTNALAEVLQSSVNPNTGGIHPADFALQMQRWLVENAGASPARLEGVQATLTHALRTHAKLEQAYNATQERYNKLQAQQTSSTKRGNTAPLEKELEALEGELAKMRSWLERGTEKLEGDVAALQQDAFRRLAEFIVDGKWAGDGPAAQVAAAGGGGGAVPPNGNDPTASPGADGPRGHGPRGRRPRGMFDREGPTARGVLPGLNSGGRPEDGYNDKNLTIQQQRAIKCGEILADPSLTIEDKIFLFMMWFTAFTDQEREKKLEELVQMDREAARIQKLKDEKSTELKQLQESGEKDDSRLVQATARLDALEQMGNASPADLDTARKEVNACQQTKVQRQEAIAKVQHEVNDLSAKHDAAPKSREVLFMEIERLNQLRDKIMNMARSIMENSNRAIEKIFR
jgi:hypothetical protein